MAMKTLLFGVTGLLLAGWSQAQIFPVTRDGTPAATIVVAKKPTRAAAFAAQELRYHVAKITGATLPIVMDDKATEGPRILVGESTATRALGLHSRDFENQEYLIRCRPGTLVLMGRDKPIGDHAEPGEHDPKWVQGRSGMGLQFDGVANVITQADCGFSDQHGTMEAWVWMPAEQQEKHGTIFRLDGANPWTYHIVQRLPNSRQIGYSVYDGTAGSTVRSGDLLEGWHHVMATHSQPEARIQLFIDGVSQGKARFTQSNCKEAVLGIGAIRPKPHVNNPFRGIIDEVRISDVVRQPALQDGPHVTDAHTTLLLHFEEGKGEPRDSSGRPAVTEPPGWYDERGTLNAVYDFLERHCDVRWYAPTELGTCYPTKKDLVVSGPDQQRRPAMEYRWIVPRRLLMPTKNDPVSGVEETLWKLRMRLGGNRFSANHSFYGYYDRFLKDHPDWFAQGYDAKPPQMCFTSPGFIAQVVQDARDYFDGKGTHPGAKALGEFFALVPMDNGKWCKCNACQAELDPAELDNQQFTNGKASNYIWGFVNSVAKEVGKTHPDKYIAGLAYADYAQYPSGVDIEPNVACMMCLTARHWWAPGMEAADRKMFNAWVKQGEGRRPLYLWLYYCFPALNAKTGKYNAFPGFFAHTVAKQMKMWTDAGIRGFFLEHSSEMGESYLMDQLEFYLTFKLADDPSLDGERMIDEFFTRYYGDAAGPMKELYRGIEETWSDPGSYAKEVRELPGKTQHQNEEMAWQWLGTEERMKQFGKLMSAAEVAAKTDPEKQRVECFRKGIWDYMLEGKRKFAVHAEARRLPPPKIAVPRCTNSPAGDPANVDWARAAALGEWCTVAGDATERKIRARLAHDGTWLYIQLQEMIDPQTLVSDGGIWRGDDWELFFAAQRARPYRQIGVAPDGKHITLAPDEPGEGWQSGVRVVSDTSVPDSWTVRLAFPLDKLLPGGAKPGLEFYANFCRATPGFKELLAWSPTFDGRFNVTTRFGELKLE